MTDRLVPLRDGRRLGVTGLGDPVAQRLVLFCHPAPGAGGFDPDPAITAHWGVHIVSADRPGYGSSSPLPDAVRPFIGHRADDLATYLAQLIERTREVGRVPFDRVGVVGWSAGGRIALALAARHPGLVDRVAVVGTPAPDSEVGWIPERFREANRELAALPVEEAKARLRTMLEEQPRGPEALAVGDADAATLDRPGLRGRLDRMLESAYAQGTVGVADDLLSYTTDDWGFSFDQVRVPTLLVYGARDSVVPSAHGRWYRRRLPQAHLTVVPRSGHLVVATAWQAILQHVDPQHGERPDP